MQRKFLEELGLEKETIDKIMTENGNDINREKTTANELKTQLDTATERLKGFDGVDVTDLKSQISKLTADLDAANQKHQAEIADRDFNDKLSAFAKEAKAKNLKAVLPFLDVEALKGSKNQDEDIKAAFEDVKKDNGYLFDGETPPKLVSFTGGANKDTNSNNTKANEALRALYGKG